MNTGLYVHIPFCIKKCNYCDFNSYSGIFNLQDAYFEKLKNEILALDYNFETVYIGGGTPTAVKNENLCSLLETIMPKTAEGCEVTVECNPGTVSRTDLENIKRAGANRLSIGLQSTHEKHLKALGRIHSLEDFEDCLKNAKMAGFENISLDLMFGLPDQTLSEWEETLRFAVASGVTHISAYSLKIEEGTPFYNMELNLPDEDLNREMYDLAVKILGENGFNRYEISNFARNGYESRHNLRYWETKSFIGVGAGAYSCIDEKRYAYIKDIRGYIEKAEIEYSDELTKFDEMSEFVFLGLRCAKGISISEFENRFGYSFYDVFGEAMEKHIKRGTLIRKGDRIFVPDEFLYVSNMILSDFV